MPFRHILFEHAHDGIAVLTVNRPQKLNALNGEVMGELAEAVSQVEQDSEIRALIVTGAGEKAFIAGADISEISESRPPEAVALARRGQDLFRRIETMKKPSIAAINGYALGGGLELAMACTLRLAVPEARLGQPEVKLGIMAGYGGTQRLPRLVGRGRALELLLTGESIDGTEAFRIGLVNRVVSRNELLPASRELLGKILANGPLAVALTLEAVDVGLDSALDAGLRFEANAFGVVASTEDRGEGTRAFLEKRPAAFTGR